MEYIPKHKQPFTFAQALELDIPEITQGMHIFTYKKPLPSMFLFDYLTI